LTDTLLNSATRQRNTLWTRRNTGFLMVVFGSTMWGLSGTAAQELLQSYGFTASWLVTMRMSLSGLLLLIFVAMKTGAGSTFALWKHPGDRFRIILFAVLGLIGVQYSYFASIHFGNAAMATFLQYLGPAVIMVYLALRRRRIPNIWESIALCMALLGTFLLVTNGSTRTVVVPTRAVVWGIVSAVALAYYTLYPVGLIARWGSATVVGWAMLLGGVCCSFFAPPWQVAGQQWSIQSACLVAFVIFFGTLLAFYLYLASMKYISPSETSLVASCEPLSAALAAVFWLHVKLGLPTVLGGLLILVMVILLTVKSRSAS
jgi:drug/metabolite transporter (DMT)-like permease